jgi:hypothetical protein
MDGPPNPPPHGSGSKPSSGLPPGNYDIFIIPPHSAGGGFVYLPSLRPNTNSFIAGAASAFFCCWLYSLVAPTCKELVHNVTKSGNGPAMLVFSVMIGGAAWYIGRMQQLPGPAGGGTGPGGSGQHQPPPQNGYARGGPSPQPGASYQGNPQGAAGGAWGPNAQGHTGTGYGSTPGGAYGHQQHGYSGPPPPPRTEPYGTPRSESDSSERPKPRARSYSNASASWAKAKEETRKREEERKRNDELRKRREEEEKKKAEAERQARATAEKEKWEKMRQREKEIKEREARETAAKERLSKDKDKTDQETKEKEAKEKAEREARVQAARERLEKAKSERSGPTFGIGERTNPYAMDNSKVPTPAARAAATAYAASSGSPEKKPPYEKPSAQSYAGTATDESYRPYDKQPRPKHAGSGSSFYTTYSDSYAPSESTARTSPPPSQRGPYTTNDPNKIIILGVHKFSDSFPKPSVSLVAGQGGWSDGVVLTISTEGMQLDDAITGGGMREWDIKAWAMKCVEVSIPNFIPLYSKEVHSGTP